MNYLHASVPSIALSLLVLTPNIMQSQLTDSGLSIHELEHRAPSNAVTAQSVTRTDRPNYFAQIGTSLFALSRSTLTVAEGDADKRRLISVRALDIEQLRPQEYGATTSTGYFDTNDFGKTWQPVALPASKSGIARAGSRFFLISGGTLQESTDYLRSWHNYSSIPCTSPQSISAGHTALAVDCGDPAPRSDLSLDDTAPDSLFTLNLAADMPVWKALPNLPLNFEVLQILEVHSMLVVLGSLSTSSRAQLLTIDGGSWTNVIPHDCLIDSNPEVANNSDSLFLECDEKGFRSEDLGRSWEPIAPNRRIDHIAASDRILATISHSDSVDSLYFSINGGLSWTTINMPDVVQHITADNDEIFLGTSSGSKLISTDKTARVLSFGNTLPYEIQQLAAAGHTLVIVGDGLSFSEDSGHSWRTQPTLHTAGYLANRDNSIFYSVGSAIFQATLPGSSWSTLPLPPGDRSSRIAVDGARLCALLYGLPNTEEERGGATRQLRVACTSDYKSWTTVHWLAVGLNSSSIKGLYADGFGHLYVVTSSSIEEGDSLATWVNIYSGPLLGQAIRYFYIDKVGVLFAATQRGVFWSSDQGKTWNRVAGIPDYFNAHSISGVDGRCAVAAGLTNYFLVDTMSDTAAGSGQVLQIPGVFVQATLDDAPFSADLMQIDRGEIKLRSDKPGDKEIPDGLSKLTIISKSQDAMKSLVTEAYIYKEKSRAALFKPYAKSYAIVIAASGKWDAADGFEALDDAVPQAMVLSSYLAAHGFEVHPFYEENATEANISNYMAELETHLGKEDRVLWYFSGHGVSVPGASGPLGYLLTYGATLNTVKTKGIPMSRLESQYADEMIAKHVLFLIDACFGGLALKARSQPLEIPPDVLAFDRLSAITKDVSRSILVSSEGDQSAIDKKGGIFTQAVLDGLADPNLSHDGIVTAEELAVYVKRRVLRVANENFRNQKPQFEVLDSYGDGEFVFLEK